MVDGIPTRAKMPQLRPWERVRNFKEVELGLGEEAALVEAARCRRCARPNCVASCPADVDIPGFVGLMAERKYAEAAELVRSRNFMPGVCSRVCQQEQQCEAGCILGGAGNPIAIGALERFVSERANGKPVGERKSVGKKPMQRGGEGGRGKGAAGKKVAVVGSGPAGLAAAAELAQRGFGVTVFDSAKRLGGILGLCIPEFRLPIGVVELEITHARSNGIKFVSGREIDASGLKKLRGGHDAVFLAVGAMQARELGIPGEVLKGVLSAMDFLRGVKRNCGAPGQGRNRGGGKCKNPLEGVKHAVVIGGGNVAMDAARCALRLGAKVTLAYRGSEREMKARKQEVKHAREEGVWFEFMTTPHEFLGEDRVEAVLVQSGRMKRRIECDAAIVAIGQRPMAEGVKTDEWGRVKVDSVGATSMRGVFAAGDCVLGPATVVEAVAGGRQAAGGIAGFLEKAK